jgi:hypothetical protein
LKCFYLPQPPSIEQVSCGTWIPITISIPELICYPWRLPVWVRELCLVCFIFLVAWTFCLVLFCFVLGIEPRTSC